MTLDDVDTEEESTHYGRFEDMCDAGKRTFTTQQLNLRRKWPLILLLRQLPLHKKPSSYRNSTCLIFAGPYTEWMLFIDLLTTSVDSSKTFSDAQKLQDLKTSLKEEPSRLMSSLTITNTNYSVALNILRNFYEKKVNVREHILSIVSFQ